MSETLELCRWVYNETLATRKNAYEQRSEVIGYLQTKRLLPVWKIEHPELARVHSQVLQDVVQRVDLAFQAFFRRIRSGDTPGFPRFKGQGRYNSLTYPQYGGGIKLDGDLLSLSKIGTIRLKLSRPVAGRIKTVTVQRGTTGKWYACFSCDVEPNILPPTDRIVGIDLGLSTFAFLSDGSKINRQRWMKQDTHDIARLQRKKERLALDSPERYLVVRALQHAHQRVTNRRTDFAHQESRKLVNAYQVIVFENLDIQDMQSQGKRVINRNIADVAWGQFVQFTTYKAENAGRSVLRVNPRGTTQECSGCGKVVPKDLGIRVHDCPHCGLKIDRDLNAALNILARGLASIGQRTVEAHDELIHGNNQ